jgi:hypothetical protein
MLCRAYPQLWRSPKILCPASKCQRFPVRQAYFLFLKTLPEPLREDWVLIYFLFQTPHDSERVTTFAGADESTLFHRLDCIAIGGQRAYFFIIFLIVAESGCRRANQFQARIYLGCATAGFGRYPICHNLPNVRPLQIIEAKTAGRGIFRLRFR